MSDIDNQVVALLERKQADGAFLYSDEEVREAIPLLCLGLKRALPEVEFPEFALQCIGEVATKAGAGNADEGEVLLQKLSRYYEKRQSPLVRELELILRALVGANAGETARALAGVIGASSELKPLDSGERPKGTIAAGPAARFQMLNSLPTQKR